MKKRIFFDLDGTLCRGYGLELETEILVDHSVAMKQATEGLKQQATYVAKTEKGVLEGLKHYHLLP